MRLFEHLQLICNGLNFLFNYYQIENVEAKYKFFLQFFIVLTRKDQNVKTLKIAYCMSKNDTFYFVSYYIKHLLDIRDVMHLIFSIYSLYKFIFTIIIQHLSTLVLSASPFTGIPCTYLTIWRPFSMQVKTSVIQQFNPIKYFLRLYSLYPLKSITRSCRKSQ